jgi:hypothetical protein
MSAPAKNKGKRATSVPPQADAGHGAAAAPALAPAPPAKKRRSTNPSGYRCGVAGCRRKSNGRRCIGGEMLCSSCIAGFCDTCPGHFCFEHGGNVVECGNRHCSSGGGIQICGMCAEGEDHCPYCGDS